MPETLAIVLPLVAAAVFIASAIAKLRRPDDLAGWAEIGVPAALRRQWLVRAHPWGELLLGVALALLGGILGLLAALVAVALMTGYLVLVVRVQRRSEDTSCACFGARRPVTRVTIVRNVWLLVITAGTAAVIWVNPLWGGALAAGATDWDWILGLAIAAVTVAAILWPDGATESATASSAVAGEDGDELDYIRTRTPAVPVMLADGSTFTLRQLSSLRPMLMLAVTETCGSCTPVIESASEWRRMLPEVDIRLLVYTYPGEGLTEHSEPQSLHDPHGYVRDSIAEWPTPTAVLFGVDGLLAGGPVSGDIGVANFVRDVYESLHGESPAALDSST